MKRYTLDLLHHLVNKDKFTLIGKDFEKLNRDTLIHFMCACGNEGAKCFRSIDISGGFCKECINKKRNEKFKETCLKKFNKEHSSQSDEIKEEIKKVFLVKYGVEYIFQSEEIKKKSKNTCLKNYGVENPFQSIEIKEKIKSTNLARYGEKYSVISDIIKLKSKQTMYNKYNVEYPAQSAKLRDKTKKTCLRKYGTSYSAQSDEVKNKKRVNFLAKYGVSNPMQLKEIKDKVTATCMKKYGVRRVSQLPEIFCKFLFKFKEFEMPSGSIRKIQGYEPFALKYLLSKGVKEEDIYTNDYINKPNPIVWFEKNKKHVHYPDIFINSINKYIEVKSLYTVKLDRFQLMLNNFPKKRSYDYDVWIFNEKGELIEIIYFVRNLK